MQPTSKSRTACYLPGILGQCNEDALRHVLGGVGVANHAERGGINQINVALDNGGKRGFGLVLGIVV